MENAGTQPSPLSSTRLLEQWYAGDRPAVDELIRRHEPWIRARVRRRLGGVLRQRLESGDIVQEALLRFCSHGPRVRLRRETDLRRLLSTIVENTIRDQHDFFHRHRRDLARDQPLSEAIVLDCDGRRDPADSPSGAMLEAERHAVLRLAMEILPPGDREVVLLRTREQLAFGAIGERLGIQAAAADARYRRAAVRLQSLVERIQRGQVSACIDDFDRETRTEDGADPAAAE